MGNGGSFSDYKTEAFDRLQFCAQKKNRVPDIETAKREEI